MFLADLHIHSKYSRATSRECVPEFLDLWARRKGIQLLGTGDFTHPAWRGELKEKLVPAEEGLYALRDEFRRQDSAASSEKPRFVLSGEISSIYKKNGKVRKVHNVILLPGREEADLLSRKLEAIGNIHSDGRPILGLDSRDLLEITLETCPDAIFIPAHIWTPHFSLFGAFSGFDTIEECFEDLTPCIHALETGLSSDPPMNWRVSALDRYLLVSNSDAHSPQKLGREANLLNTDLSYPALARALSGEDAEGFAGTIEFFPEEGKYHFDGHRNCNLCLKPSEADEYGGKCPVCGRKLTIGVQHRVDQLADRGEGYLRPGAKPFESLVPLPEVIAASTGVSTGSKKTAALYEYMLQKLGDEFSILREIPEEEIGKIAGPCVEEGIRRLRAGQVGRIPGYDGEYGVIQLLNEEEISRFSGQTSLFPADLFPQKAKAERKKARAKKEGVSEEVKTEEAPSLLFGLNAEQLEAAETGERAAAVIAGPGTGKTKTLISRIACLMEKQGAKPGEITAVTFTNKAAGELRERLEKQFGGKAAVRAMNIGTFHSICLSFLQKRRDVALIDEFDALAIASELLLEQKAKLSARRFLQDVSRVKNGLEPEAADFPLGLYELYCRRLKENGVLDFDDLLLVTLKEWGGAGAKEKLRFSHLLVDEFQDINRIQYQLIRAWNEGGKSLFVIGDPDQSIYGFRGAESGCFDKLARDLPALRVIRLVKNYRSTPEILRCALGVISKNGGENRVLEAQCPGGEAVSLVTSESELSEGIYVAKQINRMVGGIDMLDAQSYISRADAAEPLEFSDIAVLYRTHRQAEILEKCLQKESIPYVVAGRDDTLADEKVRGSICFFRFLLEGSDLISLETCLKTIWGCPRDLILSAGKRLSYLSAGEDFLPSLQEEFADTAPLREFLRQAEKFLPRCKKDKPQKLVQDWMVENSLEGSKAMDRFLHLAVFHRDMPSFLQALTLGQESDLMRSPAGKPYASGAVTLTTLHGSKGLEYPVVFLCGVKKGKIPLESAAHPADPEEERRLFYVGMTRAKRGLFLITSKEPSEFLDDIPEEYLNREAAGKGRHAGGVQLSLFD